MKENILGYQVDAYSTDECVDSIFTQLGAKRGCAWLACLNPHSYAVSLDDEDFAKALNNADWLVPDGAGVVMASRILGGDIQERVTGSDVFYGLNQRMNAKGNMSAFFLGSTEETLAQICERMAKDYPNIQVAGVYSPPFKHVFSPADIDQMINAINTTKPDVLWVGMTAPKQERWIYENAPRLEVKFAGAIGAVFDFYIGRVKRSHPVFQKLGLEWLPRLVQQPRRLWRRMLISAPMFVWHVIKQKFGYILIK